MFFRRSGRSTPDPNLDWKIRLLFLAAIIWLTGILIDRPALTIVAIVLLLAAVLLRWLPGFPDEAEEDGPGQERAGEGSRRS